MRLFIYALGPNTANPDEIVMIGDLNNLSTWNFGTHIVGMIDPS